MTSHERSQPEPDQDTRERLLSAASQIFSAKGYNGATVKEIAEAAGCNVSLISYHFGGKEALFKTLLEGFGRERLRDAEEVLQAAESFEDFRARLRLWMQQFLLCHVRDGNICSILHRENILEEDFLWDLFESTFLKSFAAMARFLEVARDRGIIRSDTHPPTIAILIFGALMEIGRNQKLQKKVYGVSIADDAYRQQVIEQFLQTFLIGLSGSRS